MIYLVKKVIPTLKTGGDKDANLSLGVTRTEGLSEQQLNDLLAAARSQENVTPYCTMTYAPDGGDLVVLCMFPTVIIKHYLMVLEEMIGIHQDFTEVLMNIGEM